MGRKIPGKRAMKGAADREVLTQADRVVRFLPKAFLDFYESLLVQTFGDGLGQSPGYVAKVPETVQCVDGGRDFNSRVPVKDLGRVRESVDRRLRKLARDGKAAVEGEGGEKRNGDGVGKERACIQCGKFGEAGWAFCPWCGLQCDAVILVVCECGPEIHTRTGPDIIHCAIVRGELPRDGTDWYKPGKVKITPFGTERGMVTGL